MPTFDPNCIIICNAIKRLLEWEWGSGRECLTVHLCVLCPDRGKADVFKKSGTEIGKQAASKSGGLFSAEDWQCAS